MTKKWIIGLTILIVIMIFCITNSYIQNTNPRFYFSITSFDLPNENTFTIGENSDVCYKSVPENYMTVHYEKGAFSYKINNEDSCLYYFVNGNNPNNHKNITKDSRITFFNIELTGDSIHKRLEEFDNEFYMLKDVLKDRLHPDTLATIDKGDKNFESFIQKEYWKSFDFPIIGKVNFGKPRYNLVILDRATKINNIGYCYNSNQITDSAIRKTLINKELKVQFFKMQNWSVKKNDNDYFSDSIRSYFAKPVQIFTEWGAGHILIKREKGQKKEKDYFSVTFPKAITTTIPVEKIRKTSQKSGTGVYLKQMLKSYPMPTDFYIPAFSNALSEYVCELSSIENNNLIFQKTNKRDTIPLATSGNIIPKIKKDTQQLVTSSITYKTRILNKAFYWSKHKLLFICWGFLSLILLLSFPVSGTEKVKDVRWYIWGLFTLFWFYLNQKLLIAEKLTFTYPYFEKIYPVTYLTTLFSLFALFLLIILVNKSYFSNGKYQYIKSSIKLPIFLQSKQLKEIPVCIKFTFIQKLIIFMLIVATVSYTLRQLYGSFIATIFGSYNAEEIAGLWKIWRWQKIDALNDNHFTVFMIVGVLLAILLVVFILSQFLTRITRKIKENARKNKIISQITKCAKNNSNNLFIDLQKQKDIREKNKYVKSNFPTFVKYYTKHIIIAAIYVCLAFFINILGNFGTAIAVLVLLFSLSIFLQKQIEKSDKKPFWWLLCSLLISCSFVIIGMSDFGFFINIFGIIFSWFILMPPTTKYFEKEKKPKHYGALLILGIAVCIFTIKIAGLLSSPENIDYDRSNRRIENCIAPGKVKEAGYLYTESDMQWMEVMRHYAQKVDAGKGEDYDIYGEDNEFHQLVASGQSPVILNDVCVPGVYLGSLRGWGWLGLLFGVLTLCILVYGFSVGDTWRKGADEEKAKIISRQLIRRLLAGNLWIGVTLYLLASYYWNVPFTGRLIPCFGIDAVGEALEVIVLFAFMCTLYCPYNKSKK